MARMELSEREISITQSAQDRRDGVWHVWTNDGFWHRRLQSVGAMMVKQQGEGAEYTLDQRQILVRKVPAKRRGPRRIEFLKRRESKAEREAHHISADPAMAETEEP